MVNPVLLLRSRLTRCKASPFLTTRAVKLCATSCCLTGLHFLLPKDENKIPTQDDMLLFQSTISEELICELIHTG